MVFVKLIFQFQRKIDNMKKYLGISNFQKVFFLITNDTKTFYNIWILSRTAETIAMSSNRIFSPEN